MQKYFGGKLQIESLPRENRDGRFRVSDHRGEVAWPIAGERFEYHHVVEFAQAGDRRGFHVHRQHEELLYVFRGTLQLVVKEMDSGETAVLELAARDLATMAPGVARGLVPAEPTIAISAGRGAELEALVP